ncbi:hypothetical protein C8J56DRAFT_192744 [Mycena floridula]|nr:hypothetical protein C8J56DRAFT_192744 [Mycena floridula]
MRSAIVIGSALLFCSFILNFFVSISLPYLHNEDVVRVRFYRFQGNDSEVALIHFGIWGPCISRINGAQECSKLGAGYQVAFKSSLLNSSESETFVVNEAQTRPLALHPFVASAIFVAFVLTCISQKKPQITLAAIFATGIALCLNLVAFAIDIHLFEQIRHLLNSFPAHTSIGPASWMTFVSFLFLISGLACLVVLIRHKEHKAGDSFMSSLKPSALERLRIHSPV